MSIQNKPTGNTQELWCQLHIPEQAVGPWQSAFRERKSNRGRLRRLVERRPRGVEDESLMLMIERIAKLKGQKECAVVNDLLWSAVNSRLRASDS